jgi:hypothetical protein
METRDRRGDWSGYPTFMATSLKLQITVAHRSIHEFLEIPENNKWMEQYLEKFSPVESICQLTIIMLKRLGPLRSIPSRARTKDEAIEVRHFLRYIRQTLHCLRVGCQDIAIQSKLSLALGRYSLNFKLKVLLFYPNL